MDPITCAGTQELKERNMKKTKEKKQTWQLSSKMERNKFGYVNFEHVYGCVYLEHTDYWCMCKLL